MLEDPAHPEHGERLEWLGRYSAGDLDPSRFDRVAVDAALSRLATVIDPG